MRQLGYCFQCDKQSVQEGAMCDDCKAADLAALRAYAEQDIAAALRSKLAAAVAALEEIKNAGVVSVSIAGSQELALRASINKLRKIATETLAEIQGDDAIAAGNTDDSQNA